MSYNLKNVYIWTRKCFLQDMKVATLQKQYITRVNLCIAAECKQAFKMYSVILYANLFNFNLFLNTSWLCIAAVLICIWMLFVWKPFKLQIKELHIKCIFWFQKLIFRYMSHEFEFLLLKILSCFDVKKKNRFSDIRNLNWFFYIIRYIF